MKTTNTIKIFSLSLALLLFCACNDNEINKGQEVGEGTSVSIILANGTGSSIDSRAETDNGTEAERNISVLEIFVFDESGDPDTKTPYLRLTSFVQKTTLQIESDGQVRFVVVANYGDDEIGAMSNYASLQDELAKREMTAVADPAKHNSTEVPSNGFEMTGEAVATITPESPNNTVTVKLDRIVSKFGRPTFNGVAINLPEACIEELWGEGTEIETGDIQFSFEGYALVNGVNKSLLLYRNDWAPWRDEWVAWFEANESGEDLKYLNSEFDNDGFYTNNYSGKHDEEWFIGATGEEKFVYVYENAPEEISTPSGDGYAPETVYALIIKGTLSVDGYDEPSKTRYWRINLCKKENYIIGRNNYYQVNVTSIKSCGFGTPEDAETQTNNPVVPFEGETYVDVVITINPWNVIESPTEM